MAEGDWIIVFPAISSYLIWQIYRLIIGSKKTRIGSILKIVFCVELALSIFLYSDMVYMQKRHVTDAGDTIMVIVFVAFLSFAISAVTIAGGVFNGIVRKYSKA